MWNINHNTESILAGVAIQLYFFTIKYPNTSIKGSGISLLGQYSTISPAVPVSK